MPSPAQILLTGGSDGIGRGLVARFLAAGATVLVTGRSQDKLDRASRELPGLRTFVSDIGDPAQRVALAEHVRLTLPALSMVVNNAGIQRRIALADDDAPWSERQREIDILLAGPVHLNHLLVPFLVAQPHATTIVNVTSGGAYVPQVFAPLYSACKAAVRGYTVTLRHALAGTRCRVVELIPPAVQTGLVERPHGAPLDAFCDAVFAELVRGEADEIGYGATAGIGAKSRAELDAAFEASAGRAGIPDVRGEVMSGDTPLQPSAAYNSSMSSVDALRRASELLVAGDWQAAHTIVQDDVSPLAAWMHGIVHLLEGDPANARYWYGRAGRTFPADGDVRAEIEAARAEATSASVRSKDAR